MLYKLVTIYIIYRRYLASNITRIKRRISILNSSLKIFIISYRSILKEYIFVIDAYI